MLIAEDKAKAAKKGLYGKDTSRAMNRVDFSGNATKAKTNLHFLKQKKRHEAIIEHVFTASHYLIYIPAENCQISFTLQGLKAPQNSLKGKADTFGDESLMYAKYYYLQVSLPLALSFIA